MFTISRRDFLKISAAAASTLLISTGISGCTPGDDTIDPIVYAVDFKHGVASGDPLSDKVIIWTRITHNDTTKTNALSVDFEVATDENFTTLVHSGTYTATQESDFTVKVDAQNLTAGTKYYYRFKSNGKTSATGVAKTLPSNPSQVKMAVFSCSNYPNGFFNAYTEAAKIADLDVTLHLGDYIYEYGTYENDDFETKKLSYATENAVAMGRALPENNNTECIALEDYRRRYALYHTDAGSQAIHALCPMIVVWDDHEIANDTYKDGAKNHDATEGDFATRTTAALQAYFEWLPIRPVSNQKEIYRTFNFGSLVSLHMLETRIFGRNKQLSYSDYYNSSGNFNATAFTTDLTSPTRTMLGSSQLAWLQNQLGTSTATWQVLGQQVLMGKMSLPAELLTPIGMLENPAAYGKTTEALVTQINTLISQLTTLKVTKLSGGTLTAEEEARLATALPYNLDAWDGYYVERETILGTSKAYGKNLVVLAGDTHNGWASNLKDVGGSVVGVEFATPSITSPGLEQYVGLPDATTSAQFEAALQLLIDDLVYANTFNRGFLTVTFTADNVTAEWTYVSAYNSTTYTIDTARTKTITHAKGSQLA